MSQIISEVSIRGHRATLTAGYTDYNVKLNRYALAKTHNVSTSDDLVQETFLKTWKFLMRGGDIKVMEAFLYHILKGLIIDEYRKKKSSSLDGMLEKGYEPYSDTRESDTNVSDGSRAMLLMKELPLTYQKVLGLRFTEDLSLAEIAVMTGQSKNSIAVQIHRGLEKLRTLHEQQIVRATVRL